VLLRHACIGLFVLIILLPIIWAGLMSVTASSAILRSSLWPAELDLSFSSYGAVLRRGSALSTNLLNSVWVTLGTVLITTVCSVLAGYALTHLRTRGAALVVMLLVASLFIPTRVVSVIAVWQIQRALGLLNQTWALLLPYSTLSLAVGVLVMRSVFQTIPREIVDAARVDGAGPGRTLVTILLPLVSNGIILVAVASFIAAWGEYAFAAILLDDQSRRTLPVVLGTLGGMIRPGSAALWIVSILPGVLFALTAQRWVSRALVEGIHR